MNARVEPQVGDLDNLNIGADPVDLIQHASRLLNANAGLAAAELDTARQGGLSTNIRLAEEGLKKALEDARKAAEVLTAACQAQVAFLQGSSDYLANKPEAGAAQMKKSADQWKNVKARAVDIGFALSDLPAQAWDKLCTKFNNSVTQAVEKAGNNIQARKDSIKAWADRVDASIERTIERVAAIPGQIADYVTAKKVAVKEAATAVLVKVLRWGAKKEEALRNTVNTGLSLGEAALRTARDVSKGVGEQFRKVGETFEENTAKAQQRRRTP